MSDYKPGTVTVRGEILEQPDASWLRVRGPGELDYGIPVFRAAPGVDVTVEYDPEPDPVFAEGDRVRYRGPGCVATRDEAGVWTCNCPRPINDIDSGVARLLKSGNADKLTPKPKPEPKPEPLFVDGDMVAMDFSGSVRVRVRRDGRWYWARTGNESFVGDETIASAMRGSPHSYWRVDTTKPQAVSA